MSKKKVWQARIVTRDENGVQRVLWWGGRFPTKRERDDAVAKARTERPWERKRPEAMTCDEWAERYLARYERTRKRSSFDTVQQSLKAFRKDFGHRPITDIGPVEAEDWAQTVPPSAVPQVVAMFSYAVRMEVVPRNPFDGLGGGSGPGRAGQDPPSLAELEALRDACSVLGEYGPQFRDLMDFAAYTLLRPSEVFPLRYADVDLVANRINVTRRVYRGTYDLPKNNSAKTIALVPPAREILLRQPTRGRPDGLVFTSKRGKQLALSTVCGYFKLVRERAGIERDMPFYLAVKHRGVHDLYRLGLSSRAIAAQAGWSEQGVDALLAVYGHRNLVALAEVDALYARGICDADGDKPISGFPAGAGSA